MNTYMHATRKGVSGDRIPVAVLGATGLVGQVFCWMLTRHPWFRLAAVTASDGKAGQRYRDVVNWQLPVPLPRRAGDRTVVSMDIENLRADGVKLVFSALPAAVAEKVEPQLAHAGFKVFTNASALRHRPDVPILLPDVNPGQLDLVDQQPWRADGGMVVANGNCAVTGLAVALAPLRELGITHVQVTTCQSLSGAGLDGLSALAMGDNVLPHIPGEEEKIEKELADIFGEPVPVDASCNRVPVRFGHLLSVWVTLAHPVAAADVQSRWRAVHGPDLPSMPDAPVVYMPAADEPQPKDCFRGRPAGQPVWVGGVRVKCNRVGFRVLVNNLVRGAAGGSVLNAEHVVRLMRRHRGPATERVSGLTQFVDQ